MASDNVLKKKTSISCKQINTYILNENSENLHHKVNYMHTCTFFSKILLHGDEEYMRRCSIYADACMHACPTKKGPQPCEEKKE